MPFLDTTVENQNLKFIQNNQKNLRVELYDHLCEDVHNHARSGQKVILPPSFVGSPRYMHAHYQDAIAIVREYHKPDFFITFTCNPNWPEITQSLLPGQKPEDRPDIVARVFNQKLKEFLKELNDGSIFGKRAAIMHIIEFQKRGLPHAHILLIVAEEDHLHRADDVGEVICAELPADPQNFQPGSQKRYQAEKLQEVVLKNMIHSCSPLCLDENKLCRKGFPKQYVEVTEWDDMAFYPKYKRRSPSQGGRVIQVSDKWIDNSSVVPHNPYLTLRYEAHINVEACVSPTAAKYLFKYVTKGPDRAMIGTDVDLDEVKHYQNMRSIGSSEACWRLFQFLITSRYPAVMALHVHLPGKEYVLFNEGEEAAAVQAGPPRTELGAFFDYNHVHPETKLKYVDFPKSFTWNAQRKQWKPRQRGFGGMVGRVHTIHPLAGDEFYLRILLHHDQCKGATSYEHLRTVNGWICETFKDACQELGLLRDDNEWNQVLLEAELTHFSSQIRDLFITILYFCQPSQPKVLFSNHVGQWWDDFKRQFPQASNNVLTWLVLQDLGEKLQQRGKCLADYNLPALTDEQQNEVQQIVNQNRANDIPVMMQDELRFGLEENIQLKEQRIMILTPSQRVVFREVIQAIEQNKSVAVFVDARGGTGKIFLLNTILAEVRIMNNQKNIALAVASGGIAATLLALGRTYHSRFKAPLKANEHSTLALKPSDVLATMIKESKLIVWDEAPMTNKNQLEALDRTLRDITSVQRPFGGKLLILAGDFRQVLPVVQHGSRAQITDASLKNSQLWNYFQVFQLTENMRIGQNPELRCYDDWLLQVGNGTLPVNETRATLLKLMSSMPLKLMTNL